MNWLRWKGGRQNSGYEKMLLATSPFPVPFDLYLLRYKEGSYIPPHRDAVKEKRHFRLNIVLKQAKRGGVFKCKDPIFETKRIKLFRPDKSEHSLTEVTKGSRLLLSLGWVLHEETETRINTDVVNYDPNLQQKLMSDNLNRKLQEAEENLMTTWFDYITAGTLAILLIGMVWYYKPPPPDCGPDQQMVQRLQEQHYWYEQAVSHKHYKDTTVRLFRHETQPPVLLTKTYEGDEKIVACVVPCEDVNTCLQESSSNYLPRGK